MGWILHCVKTHLQICVYYKGTTNLWVLHLGNRQKILQGVTYMYDCVI